MDIIMIGEAANHQAELAARLPRQCTFVPLPREAAHSGEFDSAINSDAVVISLRLSRPSGKLPPFRLLHVPGAGLDGIAFDQLADATTVCNVFEHEIPIAEYVLLAMLESEIRLADMRERFLNEPWSDLYRRRESHGEVYGKTVGLIGLGRIARAIAARAKSFGMKVRATDLKGVATPGLIDDFVPTNALDDLLASADYVVIACPLTDSTRSMIGAAQLRLMKSSSVLINISRAEVVDESALFAALQVGIIKGAVLDVWYSYPSGQDDDVAPAKFPFHELPNVVCTPHSSAWTHNLPTRRYAFIAANIRRLLANEPLENVVKSSLSS